MGIKFGKKKEIKLKNVAEIEYNKLREVSWLLLNFHYDKLSDVDAKKLDDALNTIWDITTDERYFAG